MNTILVMLGGAVGAAARYQIGSLAPRAAFPWSTLVVNIAGALLMGLLIARAPAEPLRLLLGVGVLGGFTTFSAFGLETVELLQRGATLPALSYVAASVLGACVAVWLGLAIGRTA